MTAMRSATAYLNELGIISALGSDGREIRSNLLACQAPGMGRVGFANLGREFMVGRAPAELPSLPDSLASFDSRNARLTLAALRQIEEPVAKAIARYGRSRTGIVLGTSTAAADKTEQAIIEYARNGSFPPDYSHVGEEIGSTANFLAACLGVTGPVYTVSTACSSSGKVFASARGLLDLGVCDAVLLGGADSLCELTLGGFASLEAIDENVSNPFSVNRRGINIGEGAALFLMSREPAEVELRGVGESSDAHHMSAPDPKGEGAKAAMLAALADAALSAGDIDYINLHGTGTKLNDAMESYAVAEVLGGQVACSSSKPLTGHTLGAAGAIELGLCWLILNGPGDLAPIPHVYDGRYDPALAAIKLSAPGETIGRLDTAMSNSFAFGGNNVSVIIGRS